jgi:hypothetical protein
MSYLNAIRNMGASVRLSKDGKLKLSGSGDHDSVVAYVREHKEDIIHELESSDLPNPDLPPICPFNTGGYAPDGCRFAHDLLMNLIVTGVMPDPEVGCMFKCVCGELPDRKKQVKPFVADERPVVPNPAETEIDCSICPAFDTETRRCYGIAYYKHKTGPWYSGQKALDRCPRKEKVL